MSEPGPKAILQAASGLEEVPQPWGPCWTLQGWEDAEQRAKRQHAAFPLCLWASSPWDPGPLHTASWGSDVLPPPPGWAWSCRLAPTPACGRLRTVFLLLAGLSWGLLVGESLAGTICHLAPCLMFQVLPLL